ncbi:pseudouridine-5'-phosphate glycosidase [Gallaecimonas sp. GXIMD4217]|uniref:pseudouridine-5'-phosphate glycosidase n=1 Tax=Gallaecimonas sp. GXIMD4217 TaxID=3131927 RepID=UPI00311ABBD3
MHNHLEINPEVQAALNAGQAVVALESTIISHGMPFPQNVETALKVEQAVRDQGAVPATLAIMDGKLKIGLTEEEITRLGQAGQSVIKTSRRDIPFVVASGKMGATTVAGTMILAAMAGIRVFATGGIGGVHRGAETSFDISADLQELANTDVAVVCAGAKSILDLGLTREYLETHGVPVIGHQTDSLPAFYSRESDFGIDYRLDSAEDIAAALKAKWQLALKGGVVIANPIPAEYAMDKAVIDGAIEQALAEAEQQGVTGKASTPFLLKRVVELTGGSSLDANIQLVLNNARLAGRIAVAYAA